MMLMGGIMLFMMMSVGCILCILAKNEKGVLRTTAYTLAASVAVLAIMHAFIIGEGLIREKCSHEGKTCLMMHKGMLKHGHMIKK